MLVAAAPRVFLSSSLIPGLLWTKQLGQRKFFLPHSQGSSHGQSRIIRRAYLEDFYTQMMDECYQIWAQLEQETGTQLYRMQFNSWEA